MQNRLRILAALGAFLADADYNGADLQTCVRSMVDELMRSGHSPAHARRLVLALMPIDKRAVADAMHLRGGRGRPKGSRRGDAAYRKAYALYDFYAFNWRTKGKASAALAKLAEITDTEPDSLKRQVARVRKRLDVADRKMIEAVAGAVAAKSG